MGNYALFLFKQNKYDDALDTYEKSMTFLDTTNHEDRRLYAFYLGTIADIHNTQESYELGKIKAEESLQLLQKSKSNWLHLTKVHLAHANYKLGFKETALYNLDTLGHYFSKTGQVKYETRCHMILGEVLNDPWTSKKHLEQGYTLAKENNLVDYLIVFYPALEKTYKKLGLTRLLTSIQEEHIAFLAEREKRNLESASLGIEQYERIVEKDKAISALSIKRKANELQIQQQKNRITLLSAIGIISILGSLGFYFFQKQKRLKAILQLEENNTELRNQLSQIISRSDTTYNVPPIENLNKAYGNSFTKKEYEIINDIADRMLNKEIAAKHFISINTVRYHLRNIYQKMDVPNKNKVVEELHQIGNNI